MSPRTQLIAHDSDVFDVCFGSAAEVFVTAGMDGSLRLFDTRNLEQSTILFESNRPLFRCRWNRCDQHTVAVFDSQTLHVIDMRHPSVPLHSESRINVQAISWHRDQNILAACADTSCYLYNAAAQKGPDYDPAIREAGPTSIQPCLTKNMEVETTAVEWIGQETLAIGGGKGVTVLHV